PNGWGLFDMSGNVWEWVADWYGDYDAAAEAAVDPAGPPIGPGRVLRGGGFGYDLPVLRSASRAFAPPDSRFSAVGFRLALVGGAPLITAGPVRQTVVEGDDVTFSVEAKGRGPLHYQWRWNLSAVGGDSPTLTLSAVDRSWAGYLTVTVSNDLDEVTSAPAELIVKDPPVLVSPSVISTPAPQTVTVGDPVTFTVVADGTRPLHYQWQKDGADVGGDDATFSIAAATFADAGQYRVTITNVVGSWTTGAVPLVVGPAVVITTQPAGQLVALGDDFTLTVAATGPAPLHYQWMRDGVGVGSDAPSLTITGAQVDDSGSYTVTVSNARGSATSAAAVVTVSATVVAPVITTQPASQSASVGFGAAFTVAATGTKPLHYQWRRGTTPVGADSSQLAIASVQAADAGDYTVTVSNAAGSVTSEVAALTVVSTPTFTLPGGVALALAPIPAGTFTMGSSAAEHGTTYTMEGPQHAVTLGAFYMGPYEVTQAQWLAVMGGTPAYFRPGGTSPNGEIGPSTVTTDDPTRPVEQVSYFDLTTPTTGFLDRLNALTAATRPAGLVFRLPTEAEWEYAARAGTTTAYSWGDDGYANGSQSLYVDYAWWPGNGGGVTHGTGELKLPNAFGLHNMSGNVWEWCQDWYGAAYYASSPGIDPAGPATGDAGERVARGGDGILLGQYVARSAMRMKFSPDTAFRIVGFRLVLGAPRTP
ncbi:MAG: SUMF1/EgtB/PvdO family nonheme iron enzyme, partial [Anaeromyxobacteraceae bacterium]|nr:SUMF1/EgtB/PvdO family nonheme iron enzyme [Anaeromyxobacteraceae bacterium]